MNQENKIVLRKILYAVESGGQVYGNYNYSCYVDAGGNTDNETAITIGAGQWYGVEAQRLLLSIQSDDPGLFARLDTAGIAGDLKTEDWNHYGPAEESAKGQAIIKLISTNVGIHCQDALMDKQIGEYATLLGSKYGVADVRAMMEWVNIIHQGGEPAVIRLMSKCTDCNNVDAVYQCMGDDTGNQVGAYRSRQSAVYKMIKKYAAEEVNSMGKIDDVIALVKSRQGKNQYTQSSKREQVFTGYSDCSSLMWKCFEKAAGVYIGTWTGEQIDKGELVYQNTGSSHVLTKAMQSKILPGDLAFWGPSRGDSRHVEMYLGNNQIIGHGSGVGPTIKTADQYSHTYKVLEVRRYIPAETKPAYDGREVEVAIGRCKKTTWYVRDWAGKEHDKIKSVPALKKGMLMYIMDYDQHDSLGQKWYFVKLQHPDKQWVFGFVLASGIEVIKKL
ncbi:MAG: NlpC/P60 family protein [Eubacteriales bacterium]|nr:NlpC/P60 family protein [Eubacteriales bacterium]